MKANELTDEFIKVTEIVFGIAGMVGGFGDRYSRCAAAHAIHDALGMYMPNFHDFRHGEVVAYGIFYQLALEDRWNEIEELLPFYQELNLPTSLNYMSMSLDDETADKVVEFIAGEEGVVLMPLDLPKTKIKSTIFELERFIENKLN